MITRTFILLVLIVTISNSLFCQKYCGVILNKTTLEPIQYVNIGIEGENLGTVSNDHGAFCLTIDSAFNSDFLKISCIGYNSVLIKVSEFRNNLSKQIFLEPKAVIMPEVIVRSKNYIQKRLGFIVKSKVIQAGFKENNLGYECGVLMKNKNSAILETVHLNFGYHTYDTIFYRINVYEVKSKNDFVNILNTPIYLKLSKDKINEDVTIDLKPYHITVNGNFLISLEHVKDLGTGSLFFKAQFLGRTYARKTSQGKWFTVPVGIGISVDCKVEK